jgi:hypothetical protein
MTTQSCKSISIPYEEFDAQNDCTLKKWILQQLHRDESLRIRQNGLPWSLIDRNMILCRLSVNKNSIEWEVPIKSIKCFLELTDKIGICRNAITKVAGLPDEDIAGKGFGDLLDSYSKDLHSRRLIYPSHSKFPKLPIAWKVGVGKESQEYYQNFHYGPWFTYLHVDEYNYGKKMTIPAFCTNAFKIWIVAKSNTYRNRGCLLREYQILSNHVAGQIVTRSQAASSEPEPFTPSSCGPKLAEYENLLRLISDSDNFDVVVQRSGETLEHFFGVPHSVLTCFYDSNLPCICLLYGHRQIDISALITHASHPFSEIGRSLDGCTTVSYHKCKESLTRIANSLLKSRGRNAKGKDEEIIEAQRRRKKHRLDCSSKKYKGIIKKQKLA